MSYHGSFTTESITKVLRPYQTKTINQLYKWFENNKEGHVCVEIPTGGGKTHIMAKICEDAIGWNQRVLVITHVKELIEQGYEKLKMHGVKNVGIFSAGVGRKDTSNKIIISGIQSVYRHAKKLGKIDLIIIDEAHIPSHKEEGSYRTFIKEMEGLNPDIRVVGLTATPFRLQHGYIHEGDALFDDLISPVGVGELIKDGYLCRLESKFTENQYDVDGVSKRGGEYIESDLQNVVNDDRINGPIVREILKHSESRKSILLFCTGVDHAKRMSELLNIAGIQCDYLTGSTSKDKREKLIDDFKNFRLRALSSVNVLSTGFDHTGVDLIALCRPTMSPTLYCQQVGRGLRIHEGKENCKVLDFAGNIGTHGPIINVRPPKKKGDKPGEAPVKVCEECQEIVHLSAKVCPACGTPFPEPKAEKKKLHSDDIMGNDRFKTMEVGQWYWSKHTSKNSGKDMLKVKYYSKRMTQQPITEYLCVRHEGYAKEKAMSKLKRIVNARFSNFDYSQYSMTTFSALMNTTTPPESIEYEKNGNFFNVIRFHEAVNS